MKKLLLLLLFAPLIGLGQDHKEEVFDEPEEVWISVEQMPTLGDCKDEKDLFKKEACTQKAIMTFIARNFKYPEIAKANVIEGRVIIEFVVEKDGKVGRVKILKGINPEDMYLNMSKEEAKALRDSLQLNEEELQIWINNKNNIIDNAVNAINKECIRVIESLPLFEPAKQIGKTVPVKYIVPIKLTLG